MEVRGYLKGGDWTEHCPFMHTISLALVFGVPIFQLSNTHHQLICTPQLQILIISYTKQTHTSTKINPSKQQTPTPLCKRITQPVFLNILAPHLQIILPRNQCLPPF